MTNTELTVTPLASFSWELDKHIRTCEEIRDNLQELIDYLKGEKEKVEEQIEVAVSLVADGE